MSGALMRLLPPAVADGLRAVLGRSIRFSGPHASWDDALRKSGGYDAAAILDKVADATRRVVAGEARYERDGVLFDRIEYSYPLLATLLKAALRSGGRLAVLDFGGSLGSSYRECRPFLEGALASLQWTVVEQPSFARCGREHFETGELSFRDSPAEAARGGAPDVLVLSSVLQYLPQPWRTLEALLSLGARHVVVDRTVVNRGAADRLYVQHVPPSIYAAAYPCWSLSESTLKAQLSRRYDPVSEFDSLPFPGLQRIDSAFKGYLFDRRAG